MSCVVVLIVRYDLRLEDPRKSTRPDYIPLKVIKFASNIIDSQIYNIIIKDLEKASTQKSQKQLLSDPFSRKMKEASKKKNCRSVSILNKMSKIHGRYIHNSVSSYAETILIKIHIKL